MRRSKAAGNRTCKQLGEWAELIFMAQAAERGMNVSKPFGDSASYDVGVEHNGRFLRVQVKSTTFRRKGSYTCNIIGPQHEPYAPGKLDFFAVYLVPIDVWYIIPYEVAEGNLSLNLTPRKGHKFSQYMEAWKLLLGTERRAVEAGGVARDEGNEGSGTQSLARQHLERAFGYARMRLGAGPAVS